MLWSSYNSCPLGGGNLGLRMVYFPLCRSVKMDRPRETVQSAAQLQIRFLKILISGIEIYVASPRLQLKSSDLYSQFSDFYRNFQSVEQLHDIHPGPSFILGSIKNFMESVPSFALCLIVQFKMSDTNKFEEEKYKRSFKENYRHAGKTLKPTQI